MAERVVWVRHGAGLISARRCLVRDVRPLRAGMVRERARTLRELRIVVVVVQTIRIVYRLGPRPSATMIALQRVSAPRSMAGRGIVDGNVVSRGLAPDGLRLRGPGRNGGALVVLDWMGWVVRGARGGVGRVDLVNVVPTVLVLLRLGVLVPVAARREVDAGRVFFVGDGVVLRARRMVDGDISPK